MTLFKLIELQAASAAVSDFDRFNEFTDACENFDFAALDEKVRRLIAATEDMIERIYMPEADCSCHINPPCNDCVENSFLRNAIENAKKALEGME